MKAPTVTASNVSTLQRDYPWITFPIISTAPMRPISLAPFAVGGSMAGALGFTGPATDLGTLDRTLDHAASLVHEDTKLIDIRKVTHVLPVGFGVLHWVIDFNLGVAAVKECSPAAGWLFAPRKLQDLAEWTTKLKLHGNCKKKIWSQVWSVTDALAVVRTFHPAVLVAQGNDAGGDGLELSASFDTLLPVTRNYLHDLGL